MQGSDLCFPFLFASTYRFFVSFLVLTLPNRRFGGFAPYNNDVLETATHQRGPITIVKKREVKRERVSSMDSELEKWQELLDAAEVVTKMNSDDERMARLRAAVRALTGED